MKTVSKVILYDGEKVEKRRIRQMWELRKKKHWHAFEFLYRLLEKNKDEISFNSVLINPDIYVSIASKAVPFASFQKGIFWGLIMELTRQIMWITVTVKSEALEAACGLQGFSLI